MKGSHGPLEALFVMATEISSATRDDSPYCCIGLIQVTFPDGTQVQGTCSLVGPNDILTATHVIYSPDHGGWADSITVYFGADFNNITTTFEDYGYEYTPHRFQVNGWPDQVFIDNDNDTMLQSESEYDVALIGVDDAIGDTLGWLGLSVGYSTVNVTAVGYPAGATGMMMERTTVTSNDAHWIYEAGHQVMGPGSSGGPILVGDSVIGVKSTSSWWADLTFGFDRLLDLIADNNALLANIMGTEGNDNLTGEAAGDIIDGGYGSDTVTYTEARAHYTLSVADGDVQVAPNSFLDNMGTDTLRHIELLRFSDCTVALTIGEVASRVSSSELRLLEELYVAFFNRIPDAQGLAYWIEFFEASSLVGSGVTMTSIANQFYTAGVNYGVYSADMTDAQFITAVYTNVLGRDGSTAPNSAEISYWQDWLHNGQSKGALVLEMINISHSQYTNAPTFGWVVDLLTNKAAVAQYFAVEQGLTYNDPMTTIARCTEIAAAVTPEDITGAIQLIGVNYFSTLDLAEAA